MQLTSTLTPLHGLRTVSNNGHGYWQCYCLADKILSWSDQSRRRGKSVFRLGLASGWIRLDALFVDSNNTSRKYNGYGDRSSRSFICNLAKKERKRRIARLFFIGMKKQAGYSSLSFLFRQIAYETAAIPTTIAIILPACIIGINE